MSRFALTVSIVLGCGVLMGAVSGGSAASPVGAGSAGAGEMSSPARLNGGGHGSVLEVSCAAAGDCAAGGYFASSSGDYEAFVVNETNGSWGKAIEVPGTATLNRAGNAFVQSVSCGAPGDCAAGGYYGDRRGEAQAFVVSETNGSWGKAIEVPGTAMLNSGGSAQVESVSCAAPGECAAGGDYEDSSGQFQAFVVGESNGTWGTAIEVPGTAKLNRGAGNGALVYSVSCATAGECAAGGYYTGPRGGQNPFVASETNGSWGDAIEVPGMTKLNSGGNAEVDSVSCTAVGECAAGGTDTHGYGHMRAFVVSETNGSWGGAVEVASPAGRWAEMESVSCAAAGECAAGGSYKSQTGSGHYQAFVVGETKGSWGKAREVPGTAALNSTGSAGVGSVSCAAPGKCAAGGDYSARHGSQAFVVNETNGNWGKAFEVPGMTTLNGGDDTGVYSVSCVAVGDCAAGGGYADGSLNDRAFVVNETDGRWGRAVGVRNFPVSCVVPNVVGRALSAAKKRLTASHCGIGKITRLHSKVKKGHVVTQQPKPGNVLKRGAKVALTVSQGKKT